MNVIRYKLKTKLNSGYLIALLTDLHGHIENSLLDSLKQERPDIIAIAGDLVDSSLMKNNDAIELLRTCTEIAFTVLSLGNHDYLINNNDLMLMKNMGVHVLDDSWENFNSEVIIGGLTSSFYHKCKHYDPKIPMELFPEIQWLNEIEKQREFKILLDHHPENYDRYTKARDIDLILSGHNHGGQIRLFGKGVYARNQGLFPKYDGGIYDDRLVVSRGLANTLLVPRLWNPTELVYVELAPKDT